MGNFIWNAFAVFGILWASTCVAVGIFLFMSERNYRKRARVDIDRINSERAAAYFRMLNEK